MKRGRIWIGLGMLLLSTLTEAAPIFPAKAQQIAGANAIRAQRTTILNGRKYAASSQDYSPIYIFNYPEDKGFVVVAGDDDARYQILAYAETGHYDPNMLPEAFLRMLQQYEEEIIYVQNHPNEEGIKPLQLSSSEASTTAQTTTIAPIVKSKWKQSAPYNGLCPKVNDTTCLVGCVATAWSQICHTLQYPTTAQGKYSYIWKGGGNKTVSGTINSTYDYSKMPTSILNTSAEEYKKNIAQLCYDWGCASQMNYGTKGSGAVPYIATCAAIDIFGMDQSMRMYYHNHMDTDDWDQLVLSELQQGRPVIYSGWTTSGGGHSFICDGYNATTKLFHFNYGWGDNGYYCATSAMQSGYNKDQQITIGISSKHGGKNGMSCCIQGDLSASETSTLLSGKKITFTCSDTMWIGLHHTGNFYYAICCENTKTGQQILGTVKTSARAALGDRYINSKTPSMELTGTNSLPEGTYKCYPIFRTADTEPWEKCYFPKSKRSHVKIVVSASGTRTIGGMLVETLQFKADSIVIHPQDTLTTQALVGSDLATNKKVTYISSDTQIATVISSTGRVTAKKAGTCTITATTTDGSYLSTSYRLVVRNYEKGQSFTKGDLTYKVVEPDSLWVEVVGSHCIEKLVIPEKIVHVVTWKVIGIGSSLLQNCQDLTTLTIPCTIQYIGDKAFFGTKNLHTLYYNATNCRDLANKNMVFCQSGINGSGINVQIGKDVEHIPAYLLYPYPISSYLPKIQSMILLPLIPPTVGTYAFQGIDSSIPVEYECETIYQQYQQQAGWAPFTNATFRTHCAPTDLQPTVENRDQQSKIKKIMHDGKIFIMHNNTLYTIDGRQETVPNSTQK